VLCSSQYQRPSCWYQPAVVADRADVRFGVATFCSPFGMPAIHHQIPKRTQTITSVMGLLVDPAAFSKVLLMLSPSETRRRTTPRVNHATLLLSAHWHTTVIMATDPTDDTSSTRVLLDLS
jgi:hypothetical protein